MDWKDFFSLIAALAWPITALVIVLLLRDPLIKLIPRLRRIKYRDAVLEFEEETRRAREHLVVGARERPAMRYTRGESVDGGYFEQEFNDLVSLGELSPRSAVIASWRLIETELLKVAREAEIEQTTGPLRIGKVLDQLVTREALNEDISGVIQNARSLRNRAAHGEEFDISERGWREYVDLAHGIVSSLKGR